MRAVPPEVLSKTKSITPTYYLVSAISMLNVYEELGETSRRQILSELRTGPKSVTDLVRSTGLKQPNVSNHLARMRARTIVRAEKVGRQVFYALATPEIEAIVHSAFSPSIGADVPICTEDLAKAYAKAAVRGDETAAVEVMDAAFRARMPMIDIYQDILAPAMSLVGTWYKVEAIDEAQEHLASNITERMMARTVQVTGPTRRHSRTAILGCAPNSWHVIGLRMIGDYLRFCGWRTLYLGANVPRGSFVSAVHQNQPDLVLLSCGSSEGENDTLCLLRELADAREKRLSFLVGIGGHCVEANPGPFLEAGADFTSRDLRHFANDLLPEIERTGRLPAEADAHTPSA